MVMVMVMVIRGTLGFVGGGEGREKKGGSGMFIYFLV